MKTLCIISRVFSRCGSKHFTSDHKIWYLNSAFSIVEIKMGENYRKNWFIPVPILLKWRKLIAATLYEFKQFRIYCWSNCLLHKVKPNFHYVEKGFSSLYFSLNFHFLTNTNKQISFSQTTPGGITRNSSEFSL